MDPQLLRASRLEPHLQLNIRLLDADGKRLGGGRDWETLNRKFADQAQAAIQAGESQPWGRQGISRWDFGPLEEKIRVRQAGGIEVEAWPALVDRGDTLDLLLRASADEARWESRRPSPVCFCWRFRKRSSMCAVSCPRSTRC